MDGRRSRSAGNHRIRPTGRLVPHTTAVLSGRRDSVAASPPIPWRTACHGDDPVSYDANTAGHDYDRRLDALEGFGAYWHCLESTWLVETRMSVAQVRDSLWLHLHPDDELLVIDVTNAPASWVGFGRECGDWLRDNL